MHANFEGLLETHLTIAAGPAAVDFDVLERFAHEHALRCLHIVLPRGAHPSQPMLTRRVQATLPRALADAARLAAALAAAGLRVCRTKIEAPPDAAGVPAHDDGGGGRYFESHVKLRLPLGADLATPTAIAAAHGAHLSRNARSTGTDGVETRFVTQRVAGAGSLRASAAARTLAAALDAAGLAVAGVETEYVVHDSNLSIDAGWIVAK